MKKHILAITLILSCAFAHAQKQKQSFLHLTGRWESAEGGGIEVIDSSKVFITYGIERKLVSVQADFSKSPCWFDFTIKDSTGSIVLKSLLHFVNDDLVQWQVFDEGTRPAHFSSDKGEMVYLRRKK